MLHNSPLVRIAIIIPHKPNARSLQGELSLLQVHRNCAISSLLRYSRLNEPWRQVGWSFGKNFAIDRRSRSKLIKRSLIALRKRASDRVYFQIRNDRLSLRSSSLLQGPFWADKEPLYSHHAITMRSNIAPSKCIHVGVYTASSTCAVNIFQILSRPQRVD